MSRKAPRVDEQAAADAICAVERVAEGPKYEPNGRDTAPDWRLWLTDGRVVDMEVILCTDEDATWFMQSLAPKGKARCKRDDRLSHRWTISVSDSNPSRKDRPIGKLLKAVHDVLASVEREGGTPRQMMETAKSELLLAPEVARYCEDSGHIRVEEPHHVGDGNGVVRSYGVTLGGYYEDLQLLLGPVQERIRKKDEKTDGQLLAFAADLRWLAVTLEGIPALLLNDLFWPRLAIAAAQPGQPLLGPFQRGVAGRRVAHRRGPQGGLRGVAPVGGRRQATAPHRATRLTLLVGGVADSRQSALWRVGACRQGAARNVAVVRSQTRLGSSWMRWSSMAWSGPAESFAICAKAL